MGADLRVQLAAWLRDNHAACCLRDDNVVPFALAEALLNYSPLRPYLDSAEDLASRPAPDRADEGGAS